MAVAAAAVMGLLAAVATAIHKDLPPQPVAVAAPRAAAAEENRDLGYRLYEAGRNQLSQLIAEHGFTAAAPVDIPRRDARVMQRLEDAAGNRLSSQVERPLIEQEEEKVKEKETERTSASYSLAKTPHGASSSVNPSPFATPLVVPPPVVTTPLVVPPPVVATSLAEPPPVATSLVVPPPVATPPAPDAPTTVDAPITVVSSPPDKPPSPDTKPPDATPLVVVSSPDTKPPDATPLVVVASSAEESSAIPTHTPVEHPHVTPSLDKSLSHVQLSTKEPHDPTASSQQPAGDISDPDDPDDPLQPLFEQKTIETVSKEIVATHTSALTNGTLNIKLFDDTDTADRVAQGLIEVVAPSMTKLRMHGKIMSMYRAKIALEDAFSKNFEIMIAKLQSGMESHQQSANLYRFVNMILATSYSVYDIEAGDIRALALDVVLGDVPANLLKNSALKEWMNGKDVDGGIVKFLGLLSNAMEKGGVGRGHDLDKILHMFQKKTMDKAGGLVLTTILPYKSVPMSCVGLGDATTALIQAIGGLDDEHDRAAAMKSVVGTLNGLLDGITCIEADRTEIDGAKAVINSNTSDSEHPMFAWMRGLYENPKAEHVIYNFLNPEIYEILLKKHNTMMVACNITADIAWLILEYSEMKHVLDESTGISEMGLDPLTKSIITTRPTEHDSLFTDMLGYAVMALSRPGIGDIRLAPAKAGFESYAGDMFLTVAELLQLNIELVSKALPREESTVLGVDLVQSMKGVLVEFALLAQQLKQFMAGVNSFQVYLGKLVDLADRCNTISNRIVLTLTKSVFERLKLKVCAKLGTCEKLIGERDGAIVVAVDEDEGGKVGGSGRKKELKAMLRTLKAHLRVVKKALLARTS
jgi:hypothetical protein